MWYNLKMPIIPSKVLGVGSIPEYVISGGLALADLTALQEPLCSFYQFAFHHRLYKQGYIESCEHELTSCHSKLNLISRDVSLETK